MSWKCPCGDVNQDQEKRCGGCGIEITEDDFERLRVRALPSYPYLLGGLPDRPAKIEPKSELNWNLKDRFGALVFGVLLSVILLGVTIAGWSSWQISEDMWRFFAYTVAFFGIFGFFFGEKFFKIIMKVVTWLRYL